MKKIVTMLQQKGGSGKTLVSVNLGCALASQFPGLNVAIADADPQASACVWVNRGNGKSGISAIRVATDGEGKTLKAELESIDADVVIIDLPPSLESISLRSAIRADLILIPVCPSAIDLSATKAAVDIANEALEMDPSKQFRLLPNRVQMNTSVGRELREALSVWGPVTNVTLCQRIAYNDAALAGVGVTSHLPESPAAQEIGMLAEEVASILDIK